MKRLFQRKRTHSNLNPFQNYMLSHFTNDLTHILPPADKNLGACILERDQLINKISDRLQDATTYQPLTEAEATTAIDQLEFKIKTFITTNSDLLSPADKTFLERSLNVTNKYSHFYALCKTHKNPWAIRPIVSYCGSICHGLACWVDRQLEPLCKNFQSRVDSSKSLRRQLKQLNLPLKPSYSLFSMDAHSMYTNINTEHTLLTISHFLCTSPKARNLPIEIIIKALEIVMKNNIFRFGDTYWLQINGTAMGTPPAVAWAIIYYAIHEDGTLLPRYKNNLPYYCQWIDDIIGVWKHNPDPVVDTLTWQQFKRDCQYNTLNCDFVPFTNSIHFLDLQITCSDTNTFETRIYEKPENLYLYLPPHSLHSPGVLNGFIVGLIQRIYDLTTRPEHRNIDILKLFRRLTARGYETTFLCRLFYKKM